MTDQNRRCNCKILKFQKMIVFRNYNKIYSVKTDSKEKPFLERQKSAAIDRYDKQVVVLVLPLLRFWRQEDGVNDSQHVLV